MRKYRITFARSAGLELEKLAPPVANKLPSISHPPVADRPVGDTVLIMPHATLIEDRLAALEKEVAASKHHLARQEPIADWLTQVAGSMKDEPDFGTVLELGRQARKADKPAEGDQL